MRCHARAFACHGAATCRHFLTELELASALVRTACLAVPEAVICVQMGSGKRLKRTRDSTVDEVRAEKPTALSESHALRQT